MYLNLPATIQAVGVLLEREQGHRMGRMRLLKLLYLADREMIRETGLPITFDSAVAMDNGPVLSSTYNLIKETHGESGTWTQYFEKRHSHDVYMKKIPSRDDLSPLAVEILERVQDECKPLGDWKLRDKLHDDLEEWRANEPPKGSQNPIGIRDILGAIGLDDDEVVEVASEIESEQKRLHSEYLGRWKSDRHSGF